VWYGNSQNVFERNIVFSGYHPVGVKVPFDGEIDYNLLHKPGVVPGPSTELQKGSGRDEHSLTGDAGFVDPAALNFQVKDGSPALLLGFKNFPMDQFGVVSPALKTKARTPNSTVAKTAVTRDSTVRIWRGVKVRNVADEGEMSVYGTPGVTGVVVVEIPAGSDLSKTGLLKEDVILGCDGAPTESVDQLLKASGLAKAGALPRLKILRKQKEMELSVP
jgi:hypothetical protein